MLLPLSTMVPEARVEGDCEAVIILAVVVAGDDDGEYELSSTVLRDVDITEQRISALTAQSIQ